MSRIGKKPITLVANTTASMKEGVLTIKGPKGEISKEFKPLIDIAITDKTITLKPVKNNPFTASLWGTYASHISNMIEGVNKPYEKKLVIEGIGFKAEMRGDKLVMNLGFSHPIELIVPKDLKVKTEKDSILVAGIDKELVGQFTAKVREIKKPEPYKGKGIRYSGETVRRKQGKKST
ncbi:MAG: 50S ribosomal protein L6 [Patescibacteria group bacterium]